MYSLKRYKKFMKIQLLTITNSQFNTPKNEEFRENFDMKMMEK